MKGLTVEEEKMPLTGASILLRRKSIEYKVLKQRNQQNWVNVW